MRTANAVWILVLGLGGYAASPAAAQDPVAPAAVAPRAVTQWDSMVEGISALAPRDSVVKERKPQAGPRLPDFVASIRVPGESAPAAPSGNIVIPVTTALIVLAVVVLVLLID
jgi:hypothetical protein